jgi:hypothetical protein
MDIKNHPNFTAELNLHNYNYYVLIMLQYQILILIQTQATTRFRKNVILNFYDANSPTQRVGGSITKI